MNVRPSPNETLQCPETSYLLKIVNLPPVWNLGMRLHFYPKSVAMEMTLFIPGYCGGTNVTVLPIES